MSDEREVLLDAFLDRFANDEPLRSIHEVEQYIGELRKPPSDLLLLEPLGHVGALLVCKRRE